MSRAGLTQEQLATRMGTTQAAIIRLERGGVFPSGRTLQRLAGILEVTFEIGPQGRLLVRPTPQHGPTLEDLRARRDEILRVAAAEKAHNVRVFGSVARGDARPDSDIDLVVDFEPVRLRIHSPMESGPLPPGGGGATSPRLPWRRAGEAGPPRCR